MDERPSFPFPAIKHARYIVKDDGTSRQFECQSSANEMAKRSDSSKDSACVDWSDSLQHLSYNTSVLNESVSSNILFFTNVPRQ